MFCAVHWILDTGMLCIFAQEKSTYKSQQQSSYLWISLAWKCKQCQWICQRRAMAAGKLSHGLPL